jgi:hypothetical protein
VAGCLLEEPPLHPSDFAGPLRRGFAAALCLGLATGATARSLELPSPDTPAWRPLTLRGVERGTDYASGAHPEAREPGAAGIVVASSNCGASGLVLPLEDLEVDLAATPWLHWRWRVDLGLDLRDEERNEQSKDGDDFAARVYVMFHLDPARTSIFERLRHRVARAFYGDAMPGSALNFVWTSRLAPGTTWDNPYAPSAKMIALATGPGREWRSEAVDVVSQYRDHFGAEPPRMQGIALMSDTDNSCQRTQARFAAFAFSSEETRGN